MGYKQVLGRVFTQVVDGVVPIRSHTFTVWGEGGAPESSTIPGFVGGSTCQECLLPAFLVCPL